MRTITEKLEHVDSSRHALSVSHMYPMLGGTSSSSSSGSASASSSATSQSVQVPFGAMFGSTGTVALGTANSVSFATVKHR
jgi:hypothetical protein